MVSVLVKREAMDVLMLVGLGWPVSALVLSLVHSFVVLCPCVP